MPQGSTHSSNPHHLPRLARGLIPARFTTGIPTAPAPDPPDPDERQAPPATGSRF
ncbi:MAG: hypothetical protein ACUVRV_02985 [Cyanobacteriota bacterium]